MDSSNRSTAERIIGFDVARSLAILGMILVHFGLVISKDRTSPPELAAVLDILDGRATILFVLLAGIGITLMTRRAVEANSSAETDSLRKSLIRRGFFLFLLGVLNLMIWPGDILRVYGVTFLLVAVLFQSSSRKLLAIATVFVIAFIGMVLVFDFEKNWNWETLEYRELWTPAGFIRNLVFDGFRSVFPWSGVLLIGMWLGRLDLHIPKTNRVLMSASLATFGAAEIVSWGLVRHFIANPNGLDRETIIALFGTHSMPALPLFLLSSGGAATFVIVICVRLGQSPVGRKVLSSLADNGRMALTWYVAHILLGLGGIVAANQDSKHTLGVGLTTGLTFYLAAVALSALWMRRFRHGPLEWVMRRICG